MIRAALLAILMPAAAFAADWTEGSNAKTMGLLGEEQATFAAKVVDPLCELTGDCPDNCGDGRRQLALVRADDNVMILPMKNRQNFAGAANDLMRFCGQDVEVDGLLVGDPEMTPSKHYMVQFIRAAGAEKWKKASQFTKDWNKAHPEEKKIKGPWFRKDPRIKAKIAETGYLGLGLEIDKAFIEYYLE
ncbi:MAG: hypothetical protein AAF401_11745 [Pseudomonadota bacterium]